jgi:hypothetical protein
MYKDENMIEKILKTENESLVYLAYFIPRKQHNEAIEFIYGQKHNSRKINIQPIIDARQSLINSKYITANIINFTLKYYSTPKPLIEYIKKIAEYRRKSSSNPQLFELSEDDTKFLDLFFDSHWFRTFFDDYLTLHLDTKDAFYEIYRGDDGKLEASEKNDFALRCIYQVFFDILVLSASVRHLPKYERLLPKSKEIVSSKSFDEFVISWNSKKLKNLNEKELKKAVLAEFRKLIPIVKTLGESIFFDFLNEKIFKPPYVIFCIPENIYRFLHYLDVFRHTSYTEYI